MSHDRQCLRTTQCLRTIPFLQTTQCLQTIPFLQTTQCLQTIPFLQTTQCLQTIPFLQTTQCLQTIQCLRTFESPARRTCCLQENSRETDKIRSRGSPHHGRVVRKGKHTQSCQVCFVSLDVLPNHGVSLKGVEGG